MTGDGVSAEGRRSVLITRPEPGGSETAAHIRAMGLEPIQAPMLAVRLLPAHLPEPGTVQAILATSGNAIAGLPPETRGCRLLAVGDATAERARTAGFSHTESAGGNATDLIALARRRLKPSAGPLLLACGRGHGLDLAAALRAEGFQVLRRTVYATGPVRCLPAPALDALRADRLLAALFFSTETARRFVSIIRRAGLENSVRAVIALAISAQAGVAVSPLPWGDTLIAARPNQDELLALLQ